MRINPNKKNFTKAERILIRAFQEARIKFKTKQIIANKEVDFIICNLAIEVDGHEQSSLKNKELIDYGYIPIHFSNNEVYYDRNKVVRIIKDKLHVDKIKA